MPETPVTIAAWFRVTFGDVPPLAVYSRAMQEMSELLISLAIEPDNRAAIREEIADVVIVLCRLANDHGGNLWDEVERKMVVNRGRTWGATRHE